MSARPLNDAPHVAAPWHRRNVLDLDDFSPQEIETVFQTTDAMGSILKRDIRRVPTLRGKSVVLLFYENSTRTRASFELAAKTLSADVISLAAASSSAAKGESLLDTVFTLQALGADAIVMRHHQSGAPYLAAGRLATAVINAGDGRHAHPTQALLDLYTIQRHLGPLEGLKVAIVGDIRHSRVARSDVWGLTLMGAEVVLCAPPTLMTPDWNSGPLPRVTLEHNLDRAIEGAHVVMALRLQKERQQEGLLPDLQEYAELYQITERRLAAAQPGVLVMHPGPMNEGVEIAPEVAHGVHSVIEEQVTHGLAVRMALLYLLMGGRGI